MTAFFALPDAALIAVDRRRGQRTREVAAFDLLMLGVLAEDLLGADPAAVIRAARKTRAPRAPRRLIYARGPCPTEAIPRLREPLRVLMAAFGASVLTVSAWRREHGVAVLPGRPLGTPGSRLPDAAFRAKTEARHPGLIAALDTERDSVCSVRFNLSRERVRQIRARLGIAPNRMAASEVFVAVVSTHTLNEAAKRLGLSHDAVRRRAKREGVQSLPSARVPTWPPCEGTKRRTIYDVLAAAPEGIRIDALKRRVEVVDATISHPTTTVTVSCWYRRGRLARWGKLHDVDGHGYTYRLLDNG